MSNNGSGFWVIVALIIALSLAAIVRAVVAILCASARQIANALRRAIAHLTARDARRIGGTR